MYNIDGNILISGDIENTAKLLAGVKEYDISFIKIKNLSMGLGDVVDMKYEEVINDQICSALRVLKKTGVLIIQFSKSEDAENFIKRGKLDKICVGKLMLRNSTFLVYANNIYFYGCNSLSVQDIVKKQFYKNKERIQPQKRQKNEDIVERSIWISPVEKMLRNNLANCDKDRENKLTFFSDKEKYLIQYLKKVSSKNIEIIDFDGDCSITASIIMKLNKEDRGERKFTLVATDRYSITPAVNRSLLEKEARRYREDFKYIEIR